VVGCGCGCGLEDDDERSRMEAYIDEVRAANAAGVAWDESGGWHQLAAASQPPTPGLYAEGVDLMTNVASKAEGVQDDRRRERDRVRVSGRASKTTSPTPTTSTTRKKGKKSKKPRASGLSYY
jgi:hypothetical protein